MSRRRDANRRFGGTSQQWLPQWNQSDGYAVTRQLMFTLGRAVEARIQ
jgi:hypothetical protein